ncbi:hypothetical protein [Streptomyces venezuelae]|nr:hypothetical protein [Streptomyces venezuelae]
MGEDLTVGLVLEILRASPSGHAVARAVVAVHRAEGPAGEVPAGHP